MFDYVVAQTMVKVNRIGDRTFLGAVMETVDWFMVKFEATECPSSSCILDLVFPVPPVVECNTRELSPVKARLWNV